MMPLRAWQGPVVSSSCPYESCSSFPYNCPTACPPIPPLHSSSSCCCSIQGCEKEKGREGYTLSASPSTLFDVSLTAVAVCQVLLCNTRLLKQMLGSWDTCFESRCMETWSEDMNSQAIVLASYFNWVLAVTENPIPKPGIREAGVITT